MDLKLNENNDKEYFVAEEQNKSIAKRALKKYDSPSKPYESGCPANLWKTVNTTAGRGWFFINAKS